VALGKTQAEEFRSNSVRHDFIPAGGPGGISAWRAATSISAATRSYEPAPARIVGLGADSTLPEQLTARIEFRSIYGITDRHAAGKHQALMPDRRPVLSILLGKV